MTGETAELGRLILGMRAAYQRGENAMAWAREQAGHKTSLDLATLVAYDLQSGGYVQYVLDHPHFYQNWCRQTSSLLRPWMEPGDRLLEVGVGEATTLTGTAKFLNDLDPELMGLDLSWSRIKVAQEFAKSNQVQARLFVGDALNIPLADNSVDVLYTAHSLEPNLDREEAAIAECLRVACKAVVLIEPLYELASKQVQQRMDALGYVRGLKAAAKRLEARVADYRLLDVYSNPLNPSGVLTLIKDRASAQKSPASGYWQCPLTRAPLVDQGDVFAAPAVGLSYPVMRKIPLLRPEHAVISSLLACQADLDGEQK